MEDKSDTPAKRADIEKVFDSLDIGFSVHDVNGDILEANEALGRILGMPLEKIIGKKCYQVFHLKNEFVMDCPMQKSIRLKKPEEAEFLLPQLNRRVSFLTIPIISDDEKVNSVIHIARDVTEQKRLEKSYEDMKTLDRMKEELVTNVSHELRTPLQVVQAALEILVDEIDDEGDKDLVNKGVENLGRLNSLIGDIMKAVQLREVLLPTQEIVDIDKPAHPRLVPVEVIERTPVDIGELIEKCISRFSSKAEQYGVTIEHKIDGGLPKILGDAKELDLALSHLISNAIKFNGEGGKVMLEAQDMGDKIVLHITDTGVGIPEDKLPKIFDRFYQVDGSTTRKFEGTGLGLYLVKNIIRRHGGNIWAESEPGKGTKFTFVLPCMQ